MKIVRREDSEKKTAVCTSPLCPHAQASPSSGTQTLPILPGAIGMLGPLTQLLPLKPLPWTSVQLLVWL